MSEKEKYHFHYVACFIDRITWENILEELPPDHLDKMIEWPHITLAYEPDYFDTDLFGEKVRIQVLAYGKDEENEGIWVKVSCENESIQNMLDQIEKPHITISISHDGHAVNTRYLDFKPFYKEISFCGMVGGILHRGDAPVYSREDVMKQMS